MTEFVWKLQMWCLWPSFCSARKLFHKVHWKRLFCFYSFSLFFFVLVILNPTCEWKLQVFPSLVGFHRDGTTSLSFLPQVRKTVNIQLVSGSTRELPCVTINHTSLCDYTCYIINVPVWIMVERILCLQHSLLYIWTAAQIHTVFDTWNMGKDMFLHLCQQ